MKQKEEELMQRAKSEKMKLLEEGEKILSTGGGQSNHLLGLQIYIVLSVVILDLSSCMLGLLLSVITRVNFPPPP